MKKKAKWVVVANIDHDEDETDEEELESVLSEVASNIEDAVYMHNRKQGIKVWPATVNRVRE